MEDDNSLNISITAIDEASDVFQSVAEEAGTMGDELAAVAQSISSDMTSMTESVDGFSEAFTTSVAAYEASVAGMGEETAAATAEVEGAFDGMDASVQAATASAVTGIESWESSVNGLQTVMSTDMASISDDLLAAGVSFDALAANVVSADGEIEASSASTYATMKNAGILALGLAADQVGTQLQNFYNGTITAAAGADTAQSGLGITIANNIKQGQELADTDSSISQQKQFVIDQINAERAAIDQASVPISGMNKTTAQLGAAQELAAAKVKTLNDQMSVTEGTLDRFNNMQASATQTASDVANEFDQVAVANEGLGFSYTDTLQALEMGNTAMGGSKQALEENQIAMDLVAIHGGTLVNATDAVNKAFAGSGFALYQYGITLKDGLSGNQVLTALMNQVAGASQAQAQTMGGALNIINASWNKLMIDLGNSQEGVLKPLYQMIETIVTQLDAWTQAHPQLTQALLLFVGALGIALVVFGAAVAIFAAISLAVDLVGAAFLSGFGIVVGAVAAVTVAFALFHTQFTEVFNAIIVNTGLLELMKEGWQNIVTVFDTTLLPALQKLWTALQPLEPMLKLIGEALGATLVVAVGAAVLAITGITEDITLLLTAATDVVTFIVNKMAPGFNLVATAVKEVITLVEQLLNDLSKLGSGSSGGGGASVSGLGSSIASLIGGAIPHFATGGIVNSPTLALIGEAGPEAVVPLSGSGFGGGSSSGGGNGGINIYIQGQMLTTEQQARNYANLIAKQIGRNARLTTF